MILLVLGVHLVLMDWLGQALPTASVLKPISHACTHSETEIKKAISAHPAYNICYQFSSKYPN